MKNLLNQNQIKPIVSFYRNSDGGELKKNEISQEKYLRALESTTNKDAIQAFLEDISTKGACEVQEFTFLKDTHCDIKKIFISTFEAIWCLNTDSVFGGIPYNGYKYHMIVNFSEDCCFEVDATSIINID